MTQDEKYMKEAIRQAKKAYALDEVPIGCVIVQNGKIIARGYNRRNTDKNTLAHAELTAINSDLRFQASQAAQNAYLVSALNPQPTPSYTVPNPYTGQYGYRACASCGATAI